MRASEEGRTLMPDCPKCGEPMKLRNGVRGSFYGCSAYQTCKGTRPLDESDEPRDVSPSERAAHVKDASLGGLMHASNLIALCPWIHRRGPESIHGKQLKIEAETARGTWGPVSFWRQSGGFDATGQPLYYLVRREIAPFRYERD